VKVIIVRGQQGVVAWSRVATGVGSGVWRCGRDEFNLPAPKALADVEPFLVTFSQHSVGLVGAIAQVVELDL